MLCWLLSQMGLTPLHLSAFGGHERISLALLSNGADVHAKDEVSRGKTMTISS